MTSSEERGPASGGACVPLRQEQGRALSQRTPGWTLQDKALERRPQLNDPRQAMDFVVEMAQATARVKKPGVIRSDRTVGVDIARTRHK